LSEKCSDYGKFCGTNTDAAPFLGEYVYEKLYKKPVRLTSHRPTAMSIGRGQDGAVKCEALDSIPASSASTAAMLVGAHRRCARFAGRRCFSAARATMCERRMDFY
jgi:hypothetical protein